MGQCDHQKFRCEIREIDWLSSFQVKDGSRRLRWLFRTHNLYELEELGECVSSWVCCQAAGTADARQSCLGDGLCTWELVLILTVFFAFGEFGFWG